MIPIDDILRKLWQNRDSLYLSELQLNKAGIGKEEIQRLLENGKITIYDNNIKINISKL